MAFSSYKPWSRVMLGSPNQSDQQQEPFHLLQSYEQQSNSEEAEEEEEREDECEERDEAVEEGEAAGRFSHKDEKSQVTYEQRQCEKPIASQTDDQLPTFIAPQRAFVDLGLQCRVDNVDSDLKKSGLKDLQSKVCPSSFSTHSRLPKYGADVVTIPAKPSGRANKWSFIFMDPRKRNKEQRDHDSRRISFRKNPYVSGNLSELMPCNAFSVKPEVDMERRRNSSASLHDMVGFREALPSKVRSQNRRSSWEEEVRQEMARSLLDMKYGGEAAQCMRESTSSTVQHGTSALASSFSGKEPRAANNYGDAAAFEVGLKSNEGRKLESQMSRSAVRGLWRGFSVESPSEVRWEEAAEVEEWQELQRRARSQSMRFEAPRVSDRLGDCRSRHHAWGERSEDEWDLYGRRSGHFHRSSAMAATGACCSSLVGRSVSMRSAGVGFAMECSACGAELCDAEGPILCICPCCAAAREPCPELLAGGDRGAAKKKGGILQACRRLLGLEKKRHQSNLR
ncbi:hypothetical protein KP509_24G021900 [Ceratopteris richardii]|uniref:Uncharacterized protein n=1 Tax=Ceratopteris richardii TaxID=49495 RepID=A0A8T2RTU2_CERRI|nr:hypothetical protein KP509_24G021900 [Ceratopteris richardii]